MTDTDGVRKVTRKGLRDLTVEHTDTGPAPTDGPLVDSYGRRISNLRISMTDHCNFRCVYCMPAEGLPWLPRADILTYEEITRLVRVAASIGIDQIRLTGGEPLVRRDLPELVRCSSSVPGLTQPQPDHQRRLAGAHGPPAGGRRADAHQCQPRFAGARALRPTDPPRRARPGDGRP